MARQGNGSLVLSDETAAGLPVPAPPILMTAPLDIERIRRAFPERRIEYYPVIDSTMNAAARLDNGGVALADEQTAGQGRHGRSWHSEAGAGVYCSIALNPHPVLTLALGLAAQRAVFEATGLRCDIRWPNDLMLGGRKVCGILVQLEGRKAVAGIGINIAQAAFPPEIASEATSLAQHLPEGASLSREDILLALLPAIYECAALETTEVLRRFERASSYAAGRRVVVQQAGGRIEGVTAGLDPSGFLVVRKDDGTDTLILAGGVRAVSS